MCNIFSVDIFFYHLLNKINDSEEEAVEQARAEKNIANSIRGNKFLGLLRVLNCIDTQLRCLCGKVVGDLSSRNLLVRYCSH
jgi:hypothetical protein